MKNRQRPKIIYLEKSPASIRDRRTGLLKPSERTLLLVGPDRPCSWATRRGGQDKKPRPCSFCAFWNHTSEDGQTIEDAAKQIDGGRVELLIGGSILDESQIPQRDLIGMLEVLKGTNSEVLLIETRPEYVLPSNIRLVRRIIGDRELEVAIGLETTNEVTRGKLGKGYSKWDVYGAFRTLVSEGASPVVYLLAGLPGFTEDQARRELFESAYELAELQKYLGVRIRIALETYYPLTDLSKGKYLTPEFIAREVSRIVRELGLHVFVATSSEGLFDHLLLPVKEHFDRFNATQNVEDLRAVIGGENACAHD